MLHAVGVPEFCRELALGYHATRIYACRDSVVGLYHAIVPLEPIPKLSITKWAMFLKADEYSNEKCAWLAKSGFWDKL